MKVETYDLRRGRVLDQYLLILESYLAEVAQSLVALRAARQSGQMDLAQLDAALRTISQALSRTSLPAEVRKILEPAADTSSDEAAADNQARLDNLRGLRLVRPPRARRA